MKKIIYVLILAVFGVGLVEAETLAQYMGQFCFDYGVSYACETSDKTGKPSVSLDKRLKFISNENGCRVQCLLTSAANGWSNCYDQTTLRLPRKSDNLDQEQALTILSDQLKKVDIRTIVDTNSYIRPVVILVDLETGNAASYPPSNPVFFKFDGWTHGEWSVSGSTPPTITNSLFQALRAAGVRVVPHILSVYGGSANLKMTMSGEYDSLRACILSGYPKELKKFGKIYDFYVPQDITEPFRLSIGLGFEGPVETAPPVEPLAFDLFRPGRYFSLFEYLERIAEVKRLYYTVSLAGHASTRAISLEASIEFINFSSAEGPRQKLYFPDLAGGPIQHLSPPPLFNAHKGEELALPAPSAMQIDEFCLALSAQLNLIGISVSTNKVDDVLLLDIREKTLPEPVRFSSRIVQQGGLASLPIFINNLNSERDKYFLGKAQMGNPEIMDLQINCEEKVTAAECLFSSVINHKSHGCIWWLSQWGESTEIFLPK